VTSISVNVPVAVEGNENTTSVVTSTDAAWLGVANATLASKPAATVKKNDRFVIEFS
jgi:hypothetical protein